ncbi:type I-E CRISPR-associated protein Cse1/CasA [Shewanella xiamenensis]|uniref:type I-E CRISPR-associated protein Cse1/CasA n=1 Tax=Shewanella xiamenensis TaxID=332186 RepID=UPI00118673A1|nr:type I-E CRISPR-associated protein Cse1/CasA [Shewanella xiamenensis]TVL29259.1 type I-E CRISPR-associated protein Cse1/CasA [Shewanella xiamenensis]
MNLVQDPWLPFRLRDGRVLTLPMSAIGRADIIDFALPRADFQGAAYQFAIGLLQTVFAPEDEIAWHEYFEQAPMEDELAQAFDKVQHAFNATGAGPLFMQDLADLSEQKPTTVASLLIEAPGANGLKLNTDHFIKRGIGKLMSLEMAILALFTLQINAPAGGAGYRVGLRGGGPLTTLVMPQDEKVNLWQKLWLNVINRDQWRYKAPNFHDGSVFPWLVPTKISDQKGTEIYAADVHPLHMYWAMPRRIRLIVESKSAECQISGLPTEQYVCEYCTQNYGHNYSGTWTHPFTPYKWNPKKPEEEHLSAKGQPGGITYKTWDNLTYTSDNDGQRCASVVDHFYAVFDMFAEKQRSIPQLWVFGYDMDNMKARCWYSSSMPLFAIPVEKQEDTLREIKQLQAISNNALWHCRSQIKAAWFDKPGDTKGDTSFIDTSFWQRSEAAFFTTVAALIPHAQYSPEVAKTWLQALRNICVDLFDEYALSELGNARSMAKRIQARQALVDWLYDGKEIKAFMVNHQIDVNKETA